MMGIRKTKIILCLLSASIIGLVLCGIAAPAEVRAAMARLRRDASPEVSAEDIEALVAGNNAFAFDLYHRIVRKESNIIFSPYSISQALAMAYAGAKGNMASEMAESLHFGLPQKRLHAAMNALDRKLAGTGGDLLGKSGEEFELHVSNAMWGQRGHKFLPEFLDLLAANYGAGLQLVDFATSPEKAREAINRWAERETKGTIREIVPPGGINRSTQMAIANAVYFEAKWLYEFDKSATRNERFYLLDGQVVRVPMMSQTRSFLYGEGKGYGMVELPYVGEEFAMIIILPDKGNFEDFESELDEERWSEMVAQMEEIEVVLSMPKFEYESALDLKSPLSEMGMPSAFIPQAADFSGMDGTRDLSIGQIAHKAWISADEVRTKATAVTAFFTIIGAIPRTQVVFMVDRPFIYVIRHRPTGSILFMGRVMNPILP